MGGSTNAPLGRAVIGGLTFATVYTLFFVPCMYAIMYHARSIPKDKESVPGVRSDDTAFAAEIRELKERIRQLERVLGRKTLP
jgi:hypothetical protein